MSDAITFLTRDTARKARQDASAGYIFPLKLTGGHARVRVPNINDRIFVSSLPTNAQSMIADSLKEAISDDALRNGDKSVTGERPRTSKEAWQYFLDKIRDQEETANEFVLLCFLEPRVVRAESDLDMNDQNMVTLADIHLSDRLDFLALCLLGEGEAAYRLKRFRDGSVGTVPIESNHETAAAPK